MLLELGPATRMGRQSACSVSPAAVNKSCRTRRARPTASPIASPYPAIVSANTTAPSLTPRPFGMNVNMMPAIEENAPAATSASNLTGWPSPQSKRATSAHTPARPSRFHPRARMKVAAGRGDGTWGS